MTNGPIHGTRTIRAISCDLPLRGASQRTTAAKSREYMSNGTSETHAGGDDTSVFILFLSIVRDDLPGTAGARDAAKPSISSDSGGGLGRSLR